MKYTIAVLSILLCTYVAAQNDTTMEIPYNKIPDYPETYTSGTIVSRMIDGLGFRYYWATEDLREQDLNYQPSEDTRTIGAIVDHLYGLSKLIYNSAKKEVNDRTKPSQEILTFEEKRIRTLQNFKMASEVFISVVDLDEHNVIFKSQNGTTTFPFWNLINGPIEDAVWHAGQIVILRRAAGNPIPKGVNVFLGQRREN